MRSPKPKAHPLVYEIHTRAWLYDLAKKSGQPMSLAHVPESEIRIWRGLGVTHIWLMGVWKTGPRVRDHALHHWKCFWSKEDSGSEYSEQEIVGSPYAIAGYRVAKEFGGESGLAIFRARLQEAGLKLLLDFIPNHVGLDHDWLDDRPELFVQAHPFFGGTFRHEAGGLNLCFAHGKDPYFPAWSDTAQLDYRLSETKQAMTAELLKVSEFCDGVRCDMSMLVLQDVFEKNWKMHPPVRLLDKEEFWPRAICAVRDVHPDFLFLAEAYWGLEGVLQEMGFDYVYNKGLYDRLVAREPHGVQSLLTKTSPEFLKGAAHFLENHDEPRAASLFGSNEHRAAALLVLTTPGLRILYQGQLAGYRRQSKVQYGRFPVEEANPELMEMYYHLLTTLRETSIGRGHPSVLVPDSAWEGNGTHVNFGAVLWETESNHSELAVVNLAHHRSQCILRLPRHFEAGQWGARDLLGGFRADLPECLTSEGLRLDFDGHEAQILRFERVI